MQHWVSAAAEVAHAPAGAAHGHADRAAADGAEAYAAAVDAAGGVAGAAAEVVEQADHVAALLVNPVTAAPELGQAVALTLQTLQSAA